MKKMKTFFKASPIAMVVAGLMVAGVASAALLTVYVTMTGTADVQQSVVFENGDNGDTEKTYTIGDSLAVAGNTYTQDYNLLNRSVTTAPIKFVTKYNMPSRDGYWRDSEAGIDTSYWSTVVLENKDTSNWQPITTDGIQGTLTYKLVGPKFDYEFEASGLTPGESYSLIYYADKQNRFVNFGGDNPGALIATAVADAASGDYVGGNISIEGSENLAMNLPHADDWNGTSEANYCISKNEGGTGDMYNLCRGAKIWLVPSGDYDGEKVSWISKGSYLYETDLITYSDSDKGGETLWLGEGKLNFFVKNILDLALVPGEYKVKTEIVPAL